MLTPLSALDGDLKKKAEYIAKSVEELAKRALRILKSDDGDAKQLQALRDAIGALDDGRDNVLAYACRTSVQWRLSVQQVASRARSQASAVIASTAKDVAQHVASAAADDDRALQRAIALATAGATCILITLWHAERDGTAGAHDELVRAAARDELVVGETGVALRHRELLLCGQMDEPLLAALRVGGHSLRLFGRRLDQVVERERAAGVAGGLLEMPLFVHAAARYLLRDECIRSQGLFRISCDQFELRGYKDTLDHGLRPRCAATNSVHLIAGALKLWMRELAEPLFTFAARAALVEASHIDDETARAARLRQIVRTLPPFHLATLRRVCCVAAQASLHEADNKMNARNLSIVIGPNLLRAERENEMTMIDDMEAATAVTATAIRQFEEVFNCAIATERARALTPVSGDDDNETLERVLAEGVSIYALGNKPPSHVPLVGRHAGAHGAVADLAAHRALRQHCSAAAAGMTAAATAYESALRAAGVAEPSQLSRAIDKSRALVAPRTALAMSRTSVARTLLTRHTERAWLAEAGSGTPLDARAAALAIFSQRAFDLAQLLDNVGASWTTTSPQMNGYWLEWAALVDAEAESNSSSNSSNSNTSDSSWTKLEQRICLSVALLN
jgi:hypothetical protein